MREILFRGKCTGQYNGKSGLWAYGDLLHDYGTQGECSIRGFLNASQTGDIYPVDPATVGQFTGTADKHGKKIFEGDIIRCHNYRGDVDGAVAYKGFQFCLARSSGYSDEYLFNSQKIEVIGNIYDRKGADNG